MNKRDGYPTAERFRMEVAPSVLKEVGQLRLTISGTRFPLNTPEWSAGLRFTGEIDTFVAALTGHPRLFYGRPTNPSPERRGNPDPGSEEWWRRVIETARPIR